MRIYISSLVFMVGVFFIHMYGMGGAYTRLWWLDVVSHSMVCFAIALCLGGLIASFAPGIKHKFFLIVAMTFAVGFAWEWLEVQYNITGHPLWSYEYYFDTVKDLVVDTVAASVAAYITTRKGARYIRKTDESSSALMKTKTQNHL